MATTVDSLRKAIGKKKQTMAFAWLADLMRSSGDLDGALQCVQTGLQAFPESIEGQLVLSKILVEKKDWDGVIQACEFVLLRNPYCLTALRRLGDAYAEKHDDGNRNYYYQLLHDLDPLDPFWREEYAPQIDIASAEDTVASAAALSAAEPSLEDLLKEAPPLDLDGSSVIEKAPETFTPAPVEEPSAEQNIPAEDDPFSNLSNLVSADEEKDNEVSFDDLEHSLDDAIAGFAPTDTSKDEFPTDEIEGSDISSALSGIFGAAETEEPAAPAVVEVPEEAPVQEEKAQSLSDAFDDIFGEDELPEEFVPTKPAASAVENTEEKPFAENPLTEQISAESIPVESSPAEDKAEELPSFDESGLFEKSPLADLELPKAEEKTAAEESLESSVGSSFDSLFGDSDDLPVENEKPAPAVDVPAAEENPVAEEKPAAEESLESSVENSFDSLFGDSDDLPVENLNLKPKAEESGLFEKSSSADVELPKASEKTEDALESSVESSFDSLFGKDADSDLSLDDLKLDEKMENIFGKESEDALLADPTTSTRTLAEIYFGQGVYDEAIKIYKDLLRKNPDDASLKTRLAEIEKIRNDKTLN